MRVDVSPTLISNVTEAVMDEVRQWQTRPLEPVYPIVYVDCLVVDVRENQRVINKALAPFAGSQLERTEGTAGDVDRPNGRSPRFGSRCSPKCRTEVSRTFSLPV